MRDLKYLMIFSTLFFWSCSGDSTIDLTEASFPEGAVIHPYDELPGRSKVILYSGDKIIGEGDYLNGRAEGAWTEYDAGTGMVVKVTNFLSGKRQGVSLIYNNRNGQLESKQYYYQDVLHGQALVFEARKIAEEKNYENGELSGMVRKFYPSGQVLEEAPYISGQIHGTAKWFDESGNLTIQYEYDHGKFVADTTPPKVESPPEGE